MRYSLAAYASLLLTACSAPMATTGERGPALCIAAFNYALAQARGTQMENDPQIAELKIRILYEQEIANRAVSIEDVEGQVQSLARQLARDRDGALKTAGRCLAEQEMGDDYRAQRQRLVDMMARRSATDPVSR